MTSSIRYVHPFLPVLPNHPNRPAFPPIPRESLSVLMVLGRLQSQQGYELGRAIYDGPGRAGSATGADLPPATEVPPNDLILAGIRPGLGDYEHHTPLGAGRSSLAEAMSRRWAEYLQVLQPGRAWLRESIRPLLAENRSDRAQITCHQKQSAYYSLLGRRRVRQSNSTAAFVLHERELWEGGPSHISFFGMSAATTLVLAILLSRTHGELLREPSFAMLELSGPEIPARPTDMRWADDWKAEVLIHHPL